MIPGFQSMMRPLLELVNDDKIHAVSDLRATLAEHFALTGTDLDVKYSSGSNKFYKTVAWTVTHLKHAGVIIYPQKNKVQITERGQLLLKSNKGSLNMKDLAQFEEYRQFTGVHQGQEGKVPLYFPDDKLKTGAEVGITVNEHIIIALRKIVELGGTAQMKDIRDALSAKVETFGSDYKLSPQGAASLRRYVNSDAVKSGYVLPYDKQNPGWHITAAGREVLDSFEESSMEVIDANTLTNECQIGDVVIPENEETDDVIQPSAHLEIQYLLLSLGSEMGMDVWVARNDRGRSYEGKTLASIPRMKTELPLQFDQITMRTIELIDVLWLQGNAIIAAFEIESTTSIYSGLLRMADLISMQPNINIPLYIVAPDPRRDKVFMEINRPTFAMLEKPLSRICRYIAFSVLRLKMEEVANVTKYLKVDFLRDISESCRVD